VVCTDACTSCTTTRCFSERPRSEFTLERLHFACSLLSPLITA
jgi:hypothetical protein